MNNRLNMTSPLYKRLNAWSQDRFPLANLISGALSYVTMISIGRFIANKDVSIFEFTDLLGAIAFIGHLLLLRVFDEYKDYEVDKINHPNRVLSQGLITLKHLKYIAMPFPVIAVLWCFLIDQQFGVTFFVWVSMFVYSLLMAKEFFIGEWLSKRLVLYSFSHMLVSPLMILWIIAGGMGYIGYNSLMILTLVVSFTSGISYELTRKTRGLDEDAALDSYNKYFGIKGCLALITVFNIISVILGYNIIQLIAPSSMPAIICLILGYASTFYPTLNFLKKKTEKSRKINEGGLGLFFLGLYCSILIALFI